MAEISSKVRDIITRYLNQLEKHNIHIQKLILFGSYSTGKADEWSDIDIALVSDDFEGVRFRDRDKIRRITLSVSSDLSPLPFRSEDFTPDDPFVKEILSTGITIV